MNEEIVRCLDKDLYHMAVALDRMNKTIHELRQEIAAAIPKAVEESPVKILLEQELAKRQEKELLDRAQQDRESAGMSVTSGFENFIPQKPGMSLSEAELVEAALRDRAGVDGGESV